MLVYKSASQALKHFHVPVPDTVAKGELEFIAETPVRPVASKDAGRMLIELVRRLRVADAPGKLKWAVTPDGWHVIDQDEPAGAAEPEEFPDLSDGKKKGR